MERRITMMKKKLFIISLIIFICFSFSLVLAQDKPKKLFVLMDTDKDGKVTKAEFVKFHTEYARKIREIRFNQLDTNGDGKITRDEFMAVQMEEAERIGKARWKKIDINKDGAISEKEFIKRYKLVADSLKKLK
jgi:Ca2+-binding EF-hand superfamily protein